MSQMHVPSISAGGQLGVSVSQSTVSSTPVQPTDEQMAATTASAPVRTFSFLFSSFSSFIVK